MTQVAQQSEKLILSHDIRLTWDRPSFVEVSPEVVREYPVGSIYQASGFPQIAEISLDDEGRLSSERKDHLPYALHVLAQQQSDGQDGILPTDNYGCVVRLGHLNCRLFWSSSERGWCLNIIPPQE